MKWLSIHNTVVTFVLGEWQKKLDDIVGFRPMLHRLGFYKMFTPKKTSESIIKTLDFCGVSLDEYDVCEDCLLEIEDTISAQREKYIGGSKNEY